MLNPSRILLALALAGFASQAFAQGAIRQSGPSTVGHPVVWFYNGFGGDAGPASGSGVGISEEGLIVRGTGTPPYANAGSGPLGENWCDYDGPPSSGTGFHYLCVSPNANGGGLIDFGYSSPASALPLLLCVNAVCTTLPQSGGVASGVSNRAITTGLTDTVATNDSVVVWNSASVGTKTENLYACSTPVSGNAPVIVDEYGTASGTNPIAITPAVGDTINSGSNLYISTPHGGVRVDCNGNHNWIVIGSW